MTAVLVAPRTSGAQVRLDVETITVPSKGTLTLERDDARTLEMAWYISGEVERTELWERYATLSLPDSEVYARAERALIRKEAGL